MLSEAYKSNYNVDPFDFMKSLTTQLDENAIVVAGNGTACVTLFQAGIVKENSRMFWNSGCAAMGYALPAAIGAAVEANREVICITGDGSLQMNIQELQTVRHYKLPIKLFVLNNHGYRSIKSTQTKYFDKDFIGCDRHSGVSFPANYKLAELYGMKYIRIDSTKSMENSIKEALDHKGTVLCDIVLDSEHPMKPEDRNV